MIEYLYNDGNSISIQRDNGNVVNGKHQYSALEHLMCRKNDEQVLVKDKFNENVLSNTQYTTETEISINDLINGSPIIKLDTRVSLDGTTIYKAYV